jgi:DedD protein
MPSEPTAEQADIRRKGRQRLVGAVVLALLAVVFVPMVLDPEPRRDRPEPALAIPPKNAPVLAASPTPSVAETAKPPTESAKPAAEPVKPAEPAPDPEATPPEPPKPDAGAKAVPAAPAVKSVEPKAAEPGASQKAPAGAKPAATPTLEGFAVQVGAFREEAKVQQAREKLKAARVMHYTERIDAEGGALTRLRAGPYPTREAAEKAAAAMKKAGVDGRVVPLP